jgi:hypothetical protein
MTRPKLLTMTAVAFAIALTVLPVRASDVVGIYGLIDKVVLEPNDTAPTAVQVWGVFSLANRVNNVAGYGAPEPGYLYYNCVKFQDAKCTAEWRDLKAAAVKGEIVGFGSRYAPSGRVRKAGEKVASPDQYPLNNGVVKVAADMYPDMVKALKAAASHK